MCNFNKLSDDSKAFIHLLLTKFSETIGGTNHLLTLIEALRANKPHPLTNSKCRIHSENCVIKWNKIVFKDKLMVLEEIFLSQKSSEQPDFNILTTPSEKKKKNILNMVKTLAPVEFIVTSKDTNDGGGFEFKIFESVDFENNYVKINPLFVALFFCSTEFTKKALKYEI
jgi:hypothetical protein